ncbi:2-hydroxyacid dehydrogenase [Pseudothermotoga sp.]|uniref:2-hydroxyacid dehydrogenase n=1 Tax=Pseudothermotoga sp. TaxID=2033661 RepID=UPI000E800B65|nr:2-hydroxyacid dehydrogenase [Pseudothermotoga sp.]HBJ81589.1 hydroxyacid dehydrogenase [Pseudothermotoga sp.]
MLVLFLNKTNKHWVERIEEFRLKFPEIAFEGYFSSPDARSLIKEANIVIAARLTEEEILSAKNLQVIIVPMAGVNALNWEAINKRGIMVSNCHENAPAVAERAMALALSLLGRIVEFDQDLRYGVWHGYSVGSPEQDYWTSLRNKTVCIVGMGHIGKEISKLLHPFNCKIISVRKSAPFEHSCVTSNIDWAIEQSDLIFITVPLTRETRNLLNRERLYKMKGKYLVNISRGEVIDEKALFEVLKENILAGAAIDTWYQYPKSPDEIVLPSRYPLNTLKNVIFSPHVGGYTIDGVTGLMNETFFILEEYLKSGKLINQVDPGKEY